jgi:hypothetical protein
MRLVPATKMFNQFYEDFKAKVEKVKAEGRLQRKETDPWVAQDYRGWYEQKHVIALRSKLLNYWRFETFNGFIPWIAGVTWGSCDWDLSFESALHKFCTGAVPRAAWLMALLLLRTDFLPQDKDLKSFGSVKRSRFQQPLSPFHSGPIAFPVLHLRSASSLRKDAAGSQPLLRLSLPKSLLLSEDWLKALQLAGNIRRFSSTATASHQMI